MLFLRCPLTKKVTALLLPIGLEWRGRTDPEAILVHLVARSEDARSGSSSLETGAGCGGGQAEGGVGCRTRHCTLQVGKGF